jgi:hypothetical protein
MKQNNRPPNSRAEPLTIDTTTLDVFVIDGTTMMPPGRPTLTLCLDVHSRMVVGCAVAFEPPSAHSEVLALTRADQTPVVPTEDVAPKLAR